MGANDQEADAANSNKAQEILLIVSKIIQNSKP